MRQLLARDERESAIDNAGDRLAWLVMSFGVLAIVAYRSAVNGQASWDLLALVVIAGLAGTVYRLANRAVTREAVAVIGMTLVVAAAVALLLTLARG